MSKKKIMIIGGFILLFILLQIIPVADSKNPIIFSYTEEEDVCLNITRNYTNHHKIYWDIGANRDENGTYSWSRDLIITCNEWGTEEIEYITHLFGYCDIVSMSFVDGKQNIHYEGFCLGY